MVEASTHRRASGWTTWSSPRPSRAGTSWKTATKAQIAAEMQLSRFKVARLIDLARSSGIVRITIATPGAVDAELSVLFRERLGLTRALVVNTADEQDAAARGHLADVAAPLLAEVLTPADVLGLGWSTSRARHRRAAHADPGVHRCPDDRGPDQPGRHRQPDRRRQRPRPPRGRARLLVLRAAVRVRPGQRRGRPPPAGDARRSPASPTSPAPWSASAPGEPVRSDLYDVLTDAERAALPARACSPTSPARSWTRRATRSRCRTPVGWSGSAPHSSPPCPTSSASRTAASGRPPCAPPSARATSPRSSPLPHSPRNCST